MSAYTTCVLLSVQPYRHTQRNFSLHDDDDGRTDRTGRTDREVTNWLSTARTRRTTTTERMDEHIFYIRLYFSLFSIWLYVVFTHVLYFPIVFYIFLYIPIYFHIYLYITYVVNISRYCSIFFIDYHKFCRNLRFRFSFWRMTCRQLRFRFSL